MKVTVIIDAFRAFATACYVLEKNPSAYYLATKTDVIARLALEHENAVTIGKAEKGTAFTYSIPNSPTRVSEITVTARAVLHRTSAGAKGVLEAKEADLILVAGFVNAKATANYVKKLDNPEVLVVPMGHEGNTETIEDTVCGDYIEALIQGKDKELASYIPRFREGPGSYFFSEDQRQYPKEDFDRCLNFDHFDFAIKATVVEDYALLTRIE